MVLVTYNRCEKLKQSLRCYDKQNYKPSYILVVNNCSTDETEALLDEWKKEEKEYPKYVLKTPRNVGGAGGFYMGMEYALNLNADWVWVADDDAYPRQDALERINDYYENLSIEEKEKTVVVSSSVYYKGEIHFGHRTHVFTTKFKVIMKQSTMDEYEKDAFKFNMFSYVGTCIKKTALEEVGLDEKDYFIYRDDQEHSLRLNRKGDFVCVTKSIVDHDGPPYDEENINWGKYYFKRNDFLMIRKNFPRRFFWLRYIKRAIADISPLSNKDPELKRIYRAAYWDALRNKKGEHKIYKPGWHPEKKLNI